MAAAHTTLPRQVFKLGTLAGISAMLLATSGCALMAPDNLRLADGDSARALLAQQVLHPAAPLRHAGLVPPTSGRITRETADRLVYSFKEPPAPSNVITIGVGGR